MRPVLVTTLHRGVFAGLVPLDQDLSARSMGLENAMMAIRWGTTRGVLELAATGPTSDSLISCAVSIPALHDITAVVEITPEAWNAWLEWEPRS